MIFFFLMTQMTKSLSCALHLEWHKYYESDSMLNTTQNKGYEALSFNVIKFCIFFWALILLVMLYFNSW